MEIQGHLRGLGDLSPFARVLFSGMVPQTWQQALIVFSIAAATIRFETWVSTDPSDTPDIHDTIARVFGQAVLLAYIVRILNHWS